MDVAKHWEGIYRTKDTERVSWFEPEPTRSLQWIAECSLDNACGVIDVGAGASLLSQRLVERGFKDVTAIDLSSAALEKATLRYESSAVGHIHPDGIRWQVTDLLAWQPTQRYVLWHDRAVLHFLTDKAQQQAYVDVLKSALTSGGYAIISVFAIDGPTQCSGIEIQQYDALMLDKLLGDAFTRVKAVQWHHETPQAADQLFQTVIYRRI